MNRFIAFSTALLLATACGGGEPAQEQAPAESQGQAAQPAASQADQAAAQSGELGMPDWYQIDRDAQTVTLSIHAGATAENNHWNFNGLHGGNGEIVVPAGYQVTINFSNEDPNLAHSLGVDSHRGDFPGTFSNPTPVFEGAITSNPTDMTGATMPGESETIDFTASEAGEYSFVCYIPGHASAGMWVPFTVSAGDEAGVRM